MRVLADPDTPMELRLAILEALGDGRAIVGYDGGMTTTATPT